MNPKEFAGVMCLEVVGVGQRSITNFDNLEYGNLSTGDKLGCVGETLLVLTVKLVYWSRGVGVKKV